MDATSEKLVRTVCREYGTAAIAKGLRYFYERRVSKIKLKPAEDDQICLTATVRGRMPYKVDLFVNIDDEEMSATSECDCPVVYECKHGVAVFAEAVRTSLVPTLVSTGDFSSAQEDRRPTPPPPQPLIDAPTMQWLARTQQSARLIQKSEKQLAFVLSISPNRRPPALEVHLRVATRLKSGKRGKAKNYTPYGLSSNDNIQNFPTPEDRRLLLQLGASHYQTLSIQDGELIRKLIGTGRCFWEKDSGTPLHAGPPRRVHPVWALMNNGVQEPAWQIEGGGRALPVWPMWYIDPESCEVGPMTLEINELVADSWWRAPAIPPELAPRINATGALSAAGLPAPLEIPIEEPNLKPVPILKLSATRVMMSGFGTQRGYDQYAVNLARIEFLYGSHRLADDSNESLIQWYEPGPQGGRIVRVPRRQRLETQFTNMLKEWPFSDAIHLPVYGRETASLRGAGTFQDPNDWIDFMVRGVPRLQELGWTVEIDDSFTCRVAQVDQWYSEVSPASDDPNQWFEFCLGVQVGEERINLLPVLNQLIPAMDDLAKEKGAALFPIRLPDGRLITIDRARAKTIATTLVELFDPQSLNPDGKLEISRLRAAQLSDIGGPDSFQWRGGSDLTELGRRLKSFDHVADVAPPQGLHATLREYQLAGLGWLQFLREFDLAGILADDMGLGKTVEALAHIMVEKQSGRANLPTLVIAPTSLMPNWRREAERFTPSLKVFISHGASRKEQFDSLDQYDLIVTSYALLPRDKETLLARDYHMAILDEAQYIKNPRTIYADVVRQLKARHRLCLTGTPMENHLGELWSIMHFLMPGFLADEKRFKRLFRDPIEKHNDPLRRAELVRRIKPFVLRRRKEDVAKELPEKTQIIRTVELSGSQRDLYETIRLAMHEKVQNEIAGKGLARSHIIILEALLKLRQVCCDPRLVKLTMAAKVKESAKFELLMDMVPEMLAEGRRILLFSQFTSMLELIEAELNKRKIKYVKLTGETRDRESPVKAFQSNNVPLFLISLKAGGTGLNLTAADTVIHYDPWWNPAVENQATDRAHRIGQDKKVFVYKLVTQGTVEEKILAMQERKRALVQGVLGEGAGTGLALTAADLKMLFEPV